jgi:tetrahydromethanopterin S-methyltransferase subunit G
VGDEAHQQAMSGVVDLPLVMLQKAQHAAEAAAASAKLLETEAGLRLTSIEARMVGVEGRLSSLYAGQGTHTVALMRLADTQSDHTARFDKIDQRLDHIDRRLDHIDQRLHQIDTRFDKIEQTLAAILAKLP